MEYFTIAVTALIGAIVAFLFSRLEKKLDQIEKEQNQNHKEQVAIRIAERELMLAMAETVALTGKKVDNAAGVNGELLASVEKTEQKEAALQKIVTQFTVEHTT